MPNLAQGDFFGEMAIIDGRQRSADAHVIEDARLAILSRDSFLSFVRNNPDVALKMLSALTDGCDALTTFFDHAFRAT